MIINILNSTKDNPYSPYGIFNLRYLLNNGILNSDKSALMSRLKTLLSNPPFKTIIVLKPAGEEFVRQ
jgi:hypothetical protein